MLPFEQHGASVRVTAERLHTPPRFTAIRYELRVITDEPPTHIGLPHRNLAKYRTVLSHELSRRSRDVVVAR